jgi:hypothetical protein
MSSIESSLKAVAEILDLIEARVEEDPADERNLTLLSDATLVAVCFVIEHCPYAPALARVG